jgi:hypothetical protein
LSIVADGTPLTDQESVEAPPKSTAAGSARKYSFPSYLQGPVSGPLA